VQDLDEIRYRRNYLDAVIARIDFLSPLEVLEKTLNSKISRRVKDFFPIAEPRDVLAREFLISPVETRTKTRPSKEWVFYGKEREKRFVIGSGALYISYSSYSTFEEFKEPFLAVVEETFEVFPDLQGKRFGLRYINKFDLPEENPPLWDEFDSGMLNLFTDPCLTF
jgi:uncharacterized protein (TIGR04255 family)